MPLSDDLVPVADASAFIFTGSIARTGVSTVPSLPVDDATAVISVEDVIKAPPGLRFAGGAVTVQLVHPLAGGQYLFFADPWAVGGGIAVRERAHLHATAATHAAATAAIERGYAALIARRVEPTFLVAMGTVGAVRSLLAPAGKARQGAVGFGAVRD